MVLLIVLLISQLYIEGTSKVIKLTGKEFGQVHK